MISATLKKLQPRNKLKIPPTDAEMFEFELI